MKHSLLLTVLTAANFAMLLYQLIPRPAQAQAAPAVAPVLRGRMLEIVDDQGRVRASIRIQPAETFKPTGKWYPETVMLRLIDAKGRPEVKIGASEQGGGIGLIGESDATQAHLDAAGADASLRLLTHGGRQQVIQP